MQKSPENRKYENRAEKLQKALDVVKKIHDTAWWVVRQNMPEYDYFEMPSFEIAWIRSEIKRLWDMEILQEEALYLWEKAVLGF